MVYLFTVLSLDLVPNSVCSDKNDIEELDDVPEELLADPALVFRELEVVPLV